MVVDTALPCNGLGAQSAQCSASETMVTSDAVREAGNAVLTEASAKQGELEIWRWWSLRPAKGKQAPLAEHMFSNCFQGFLSVRALLVSGFGNVLCRATGCMQPEQLLFI